MYTRENNTPLLGKKAFLLLLLVFFGIALLKAQQNNYEQISWEEEEVVEKNYPADEAIVYMEGKEVSLKESYGVSRSKTIEINIRNLLPSSYVTIHIKKGGITLKKLRFPANEKGELILETKTGNRKLKGSAVIYYIPKSGVKKKREIALAVN